MSKKPGYLVKTKTGKTGRTYHSDKLVFGKVCVYIVDEDHQETGEKLLCWPDDLELNGNID